MVMPCLCDPSLIKVYHGSNLAQDFGVKAMIAVKGYGTQPELRFASVFGHMHMNRLPWVAFVGVEEIAEAVMAKDCGHFGSDAPIIILGRKIF
jgi:hypothetical protein